MFSWTFDKADVSGLALLSVDEMYAADKWAMEAGTSGEQLMDAAGRAVADEVIKRWPKGQVAVLCGPGNNGGDGFVAARYLTDAGWSVKLALLCDRSALKGDAAVAAGRWTGEVESFSEAFVEGADVVIDAVFGAGLNREVDGVVAATLRAAAARPVVAVDVPSGVNGDSGLVLGYAPHAAVTVTFFQRKTGHLLFPGRDKCGELVVADIGIAADALDVVSPLAVRNAPALWLAQFPWLTPDLNKFSRGMACIAGGQEMTGAARLASRAAQRCGAGYIVLASPEKAATLYRVSLESVVVKGFRDTAGYSSILDDARMAACLIGPGLGQDFGCSERVLTTLRSGKPTVLDADALSLFKDSRDVLFNCLQAHTLMTPHEGEFSRLFPELVAEQNKLERARKAAQIAGCTVLLKGADTVIATPDGRAVICDNTPPDLAAAGTGDVLAGAITGLLSRTGDPFLSAIIGAWLHGEAARNIGVGLIAEDLPQAMKDILNFLKK